MEASQLKAQLQQGNPVFGMMIYSADGLRWERTLKNSPLDYILIDAEHGSKDRQEMANLSLMCRASGLTAIVRISNPDPVLVANALDAGADGVLAPYCEDPEQVKECAWKVKLHPMKGKVFEDAMNYNKFPSSATKEYISKRHTNHIFIMGIESQHAVDNLETLLDCAPMDGVFVGPNDLTTSMGIPDELNNPEYKATLHKIVSEADKRNIPVMVHHQNINASMLSVEVGARFMLHGMDAGLLSQIIEHDFKKLRDTWANTWNVDLKYTPKTSVDEAI